MAFCKNLTEFDQISLKKFALSHRFQSTIYDMYATMTYFDMKSLQVADQSFGFFGCGGGFLQNKKILVYLTANSCLLPTYFVYQLIHFELSQSLGGAKIRDPHDKQPHHPQAEPKQGSNPQQ